MDPTNPGDVQVQRHTKKLVSLLLAPSWLSTFFGAVLAISIFVGMVFEGHYQGSDFQRQYLNWRVAVDTDSTTQAASTLQHTTANAVGYVELAIFWYVIGLVVYLALLTIYRTIRSANETYASLHYVNISRSQYLRGLYLHLALRTLALALWAGYTVVTLRTILPYLLGAMHVADGHYPSVGAIGLFAAAILGFTATFHLHVVLLRFFLLRPRVFHDEDYLVTMSGEH